jgi:anti-sigma factor RsiW
MSENSTLSHILRYVYDECNPAEAQHVEQHLLSDDRLYNATAEIMHLQRQISSAALEPRHSSLQAIMDYASAKNKNVVKEQ